jgi:hypothetical protein
LLWQDTVIGSLAPAGNGVTVPGSPPEPPLSNRFPTRSMPFMIGVV